MIKLIRFVGLIIQSILIEFLHVFGLVAFLLAAALGYFRLPSWLVPIVGIVCGIIADKFIDQTRSHRPSRTGGVRQSARRLPGDRLHRHCRRRLCRRRLCARGGASPQDRAGDA